MKLKINRNQIKKEFANSYLISIPHTRGHHFYITKKCCYPKKWYATIYLNEDYTYHCVSGARMLNNFEMSGEELIEALKNVNEQVSNNTIEREAEDVFHNIPEKKEAKGVDVIDELKR